MDQNIASLRPDGFYLRGLAESLATVQRVAIGHLLPVGAFIVRIEKAQIGDKMAEVVRRKDLPGTLDIVRPTS